MLHNIPMIFSFVVIMCVLSGYYWKKNHLDFISFAGIVALIVFFFCFPFTGKYARIT